MNFINAVRRYLEPGMFQFTLAILFGAVGVLWAPLGLPDLAALTRTAQAYFEQYGLITLFVASFIESVFMISFYFPGSFVVVLAILVSDRSLSSLSIIVLIGWSAVLAATAINYWLGREGFYRFLLKFGSRQLVDRMQVWLNRNGPLTIFLSAFHPNFLAVGSICMGIAREGLLKTLGLSFIGIAFWIPVSVYVLGFVLPNPQEDTAFLYWFVVGFLVLWGSALVAKEKLKLRNQS